MMNAVKERSKVRYFEVEIALTADKFDRVVGDYLSVLCKYGVVSYPNLKAALFFDYCERINLKVNQDSTRKLIWLDGCEDGVKKIISDEPVKSKCRYSNIKGIIEKGS